MNFLHTWHPSQILFSVGGLTVYWYGLMLMFGALAGYFLVLSLAKRASFNTNHIGNIFTLVIIFGLLGARLYHVLNEVPYYLQHPNEILKIWHGGLAIHGAIIAGLLTVWWYAKKHALNLWQLTDLLIPGLTLGQVIGRWGNYFNQELFGRPTDLAWGIPIDPIRRPESFNNYQFFHPTFLYESIGNLIIVSILVWLHRHSTKPGTITLAYFIGYALLRIATESIRIDRTPIIAGIRLPIIVSALMIVASVAVWFVLRRSSPHPPRPRPNSLTHDSPQKTRSSYRRLNCPRTRPPTQRLGDDSIRKFYVLDRDGSHGFRPNE